MTEPATPPEAVPEKRDTRFQPGNKLSPGRPKGSRNKLGEDFIAKLQADFAEHGVTAIAEVRTKRPSDYLKVIASLVPQQIEFRTPREELSDDELDRLIGALESAKTRPIEVVSVEAIAPAPGASPEPSAPSTDGLSQLPALAPPSASEPTLGQLDVEIVAEPTAQPDELCNDASVAVDPPPHRVGQPRARAQGGPIPQPPGQKSS